MIINGATAGGFSPISVFGSIVNGVVEREALDENAMLLFLASFVFNFVLSIVVFFLFGGRKLLKKRVDTGDDDESSGRFERRKQEEAATAGARPPMAGGSATTFDEEMPELDRDKILTLLGIVTLIGVVLAFEVNVGFVALSIALVLALVSPQATKDAVSKVAWPTVLLICGIVMYVTLLENLGTIEWLGNQVTKIGAPLLAALIICYIGGAVSAFASTTGIFGRADSFGGAVPGDRRRWRRRPDHRAGDLVVGRRLEPVLDERRFDGGQHAGGEARLRVQAAHAVGHEHGPDRPAGRVADLRGAGLAVI